jgi:hypothetical protein
LVEALGRPGVRSLCPTGTIRSSCWRRVRLRAPAECPAKGDNLKAGVTKAQRYEPTLNAAYAELAAHYGDASPVIA